MDAKELMIGDWVLLNGEPKQVMEILFGSITIDCYPIEEYYVEPIPLTTEILEKNGIVYDYDQEECVADYTYITLKGYQYHEENALIDYYNGHIKLINDITNTVIDMNIN